MLTPLLRGVAADTGATDQLSMLQRTLLSRPNLQTLISRTDLGLSVGTPDQRERLIDALSTAVKMQSQEKNLFSIEYTNSNPRLARDVVQTLLSIFTESATASNRSEMENAQQFLRRQIASYEAQLHAVEERRAAFRSKYAGVLPLDGIAGGGVEAARDALARIEIQLQDAKALEVQLRQRMEGMPPVLAGADLPSFPGAATPLAQAEAKLSELRTLYTDNYPGVIEQEKLVRQLRRDGGGRAAPGPASRGGIPNPIYDQLMVKLVDVQSSVASLTHQREVAQANLDRIERIRRDQPALLAEYQNLDRDYGVLRKNYDELQARLQAASIAAAADTQADKVRLRVIDPPDIPLLPVWPSRPMLLIGVLVAGLGVGGATVVLLAQFDRSFSTLEDLRALGLPGTRRPVRYRRRPIRKPPCPRRRSGRPGPGAADRPFRRAASSHPARPPGLTPMSNESHLIERAAARLVSAVPGALGSVPATAPGPLEASVSAPRDAARPPAVPLALLERAGLMAGTANRDRIAEELWLVQRQVLRAAFAPAGPETGAYPNLLMVTSPRAGEGKSFTALNLAASIARQGDHPVLLIDADAKAASLSELVALRQAPGLLDLAGEGSLDAARLEHPTALDRLSILPVGRVRARGSDLLASRHVAQLLHGLARRQSDRLVILDAPPCLVTSDPAALARIVGQIILVVEAERTQRAQVEAALDLIQDCPAINLVLNKMQHDGGHAFGAYAPYYTS